jgi:hypothetical protein
MLGRDVVRKANIKSTAGVAVWSLAMVIAVCHILARIEEFRLRNGLL